VGRLRPGINSRLAADHLAGEGIDFLAADALISLLPAFPRVAAGKDFTVITPAEKRLGRRLEDDRADMLVGQHGFLLVPPAVVLHEEKDTVHRTDEQLVLRRLTYGKRLTSGR
jgi:hypothetical protein